jgi:hypothetical protein
MALIIYIIRRDFIPGVSAIITIRMLSSTLSITTEANVTESMLVETEDDFDQHHCGGQLILALIIHIIRREFIPGVSAIITIRMMPYYTWLTWETAVGNARQCPSAP